MSTPNWAKRVAEWRRSGLTSTVFSEGKDFTASGLRHMAYRLKAQRPPMRLARVTVSAPVVTGCTAESAVVIEVGAARVAIRSGFSPGTLTAVLDVLERRGAR